MVWDVNSGVAVQKLVHKEDAGSVFQCVVADGGLLVISKAKRFSTLRTADLVAETFEFSCSGVFNNDLSRMASGAGIDTMCVCAPVVPYR